MATSLVQVAETLREIFPIRGDLVSLELVLDPDAKEANAEGRVVVRLVVWDSAADGSRTIRDVKEQDLWFFDPTLLAGDVPLLAFFRGWALAAGEVFRRAPVDVFETLMPHDLIDTDVLKLRKATTPEDYQKAFLVKSRLGKFLPVLPTEPS